jgi:hypothetical protein
VGHGQDKQDRILLQDLCEHPRQLATSDPGFSLCPQLAAASL